MLDSFSEEKITVHEISKDELLKHHNSELESILSDFQALDFSKHPYDDPLDVMNYNEGKEANPFDKIAKYYGRGNKNVFLFISMLRDKKYQKEIIDIIKEKCNDEDKEHFLEIMNIYLDRIGKGENDATEFLNSDEFPDTFFHGYHVGPNRNIHENLNINITKSEQTLETSSFFSRRILRMEEEKSQMRKAKIYSSGKRIMTETNENEKRNYSFSKLATCDIEISWNAKDEFGKDLNCIIVLNVNSGKISIKMATINGQIIEPKEISELTKQNEALLIKNKTLHEVFEECLVK